MICFCVGDYLSYGMLLLYSLIPKVKSGGSKEMRGVKPLYHHALI